MKKNIITYFFSILLTFSFFFLTAQNNAIKSLQNFAEAIHNDTAKIATLIELSQKYQDSDPDKAFTYAFQALILSTNLHYLPDIGNAHNNLGDLYWYTADYVSSSENYSEALRIFEDLNDKAAIADCYRNIGWINFINDNYPEALNNYATALSINQEFNRKKESGQNYNDIGIVYKDLKRYNEAINSFQNALMIQQAEGNRKEMAAIYDNISDVYWNMGNRELAFENMQRSITISEEIGHKRYMAESYIKLSGYYIMIDDSIHKATIPINKGLSYANEIKDKKIIKDAYLQYAKLYEKQGDYNKALDYAERSLYLLDTIYDEANNRQLIEMAAKYKSDKKMRAINDLKKDKQIAEEKLLREKKLKIYLASFCFMILVFAFILYRSNTQKQKINSALSKASKEIEEKNKSITDSINYSKHIQEVCLPSKELKYKLFRDIFILFKPKDIVSGDFYWYTEKNGKKLIACCDCTGHGVPGALMSMIGNNTLNKIVNEKGITSPDEILNQLHKEIRKTLKQDEQTESKDGMDIAICSLTPTPSPHFDSAQGRPGEENWMLCYAGANRPLWVVGSSEKAENSPESGVESSETLDKNTTNNKPQTTNRTLKEIKPDKFSIGGYQSENERKFTKHTLTLSKEDAIYMFSDGFIDQFGGEKNKKYTSKRFRELLISNYKKPMSEQENSLNTTINIWKRNQEQIDDILVIGIRI